MASRRSSAAIAHGLLVRAIGERLLSKNGLSLRRLTAISNRHFSPKSVLSMDRDLVMGLIGTRGLSEQGARNLIHEAKKKASEINESQLRDAVSILNEELLKEIGADGMAKRVSMEREILTAQTIVDGARRAGVTLNEDRENVKAEDTVASFMSSVIPEKKTPERKVDALALTIAQKKFSEHLSSLGEPVAKLIREYAKKFAACDDRGVQEMVTRERAEMLPVLRKARRMDEFKKDEIMSKRLDEAISRLESIGKDDSVIGELALFRRLCVEIQSE